MESTALKTSVNFACYRNVKSHMFLKEGNSDGIFLGGPLSMQDPSSDQELRDQTDAP